MVINVLILIGTFIFMETVAWATHKYVMHGFLWHLHKDHHHKDHNHFLERNDAFFLIFAVPSFICIYFGAQYGGWGFPSVWVGFGIMAYGLAYFWVHDIFIHQRVKFLTRTKNRYLRAIRKAHKIHHKHLGKEQGECFGMLWVPLKYFKEAKSIR